MTGYRTQEKHYKLVFEDDEFEGLEVVAKSLSVGDFLKMTELAGKGSDVDSGNIRTMFETLAASLVYWNLEDEKGKKVPSTLAGIMSQDFDFIMSIIGAWMEGMAAVSPKSQKTSNPGSALASLPMETLTSR
jgi:hypothetical protein